MSDTHTTRNVQRQNISDPRDLAISKGSKGGLAIREDSSQGAFVVANRTLQAGEILLECPSASIALDSIYRQSHCGFCANEILHGDNRDKGASSPCSGCQVLSICRKCHDDGVSKWHSQSGECKILQCLVASFRQVFSEFQEMPFPTAAQQIDPIYIITIRLAHRRQLDRGKPYDNNPLPNIDWKLFDLLYSCPIP
jgi:hypothetical protein